MKKSIRGRIVALAVVCAMILAACGGSQGGSSQGGGSEGDGSKEALIEEVKDMLEELKPVYEDLESKNFNSALDGFTRIIEKDANQPDAYIGLARTYSALGKHSEARDAAQKGYEATHNETLGNMTAMYSRVCDNESVLEGVVNVLKSGEMQIDQELGENYSGIKSATLEEVWTTLDSEETWDVYDGSTDVIIYPVDAEKDEYLLIYPNGYCYLGTTVYTPYSEVADAEDRDSVIVPQRNGHGVWAGVGEDRADLYIGDWNEEQIPENKGKGGLYAFQYLPEGARYVCQGSFKDGQIDYDDLFKFYGSSDEFLEDAMDMNNTGYGEIINYDCYSDLEYQAIYPFELSEPSQTQIVDRRQGMKVLMEPVHHTKTVYSGEYQNKEWFDRIDGGERNQVYMESMFLLEEYNLSDLAAEGNLRYYDTVVWDIDQEHGMSIMSKGDIYAVIDSDGNVDFATIHFFPYAYIDKVVWFTDSGFSGFKVMDPGTENVYSGNIYDVTNYPDKPDADVWLLEFDWEGNEINREYVCGLADSDSHANKSEYNVDNFTGIGEDYTAPDATIKAVKTETEIKITDLNDNECGTITLFYPSNWEPEMDSDGWFYSIYGNMITVRFSYGDDKQGIRKSYVYAVTGPIESEEAASEETQGEEENAASSVSAAN